METQTPSDNISSPTQPAEQIVCLCLESFKQGDQAYLNLVPPTASGIPLAMVICNKCWLKLTLYERAMINIVTTPATQEPQLDLSVLCPPAGEPDIPAVSKFPFKTVTEIIEFRKRAREHARRNLPGSEAAQRPAQTGEVAGGSENLGVAP